MTAYAPNETTPLVAAEEEQQPPPARHAAKRSPYRAQWCLLSIVYVLLALGLFRGLFPLRHIFEPGTGGGEVSYDGEHIKWTPCGEIADHPLECSGIDVPMDHFNATNSGDKTFYIPLIRLRGRNATKNLLLNPGGPGGSGLQFVFRRGESLNEIVGEGFHLLSFDPRGINGSRPLASCYQDDDTRRKLAPVHDFLSKSDAGEIFAWSQNYVRACAETTGEHGAYINTPQTAADMNSILDAVGQADMFYWGFSYGTLLGQTYATLFPERSARVIIDGVANQFDWYEQKYDKEAFEDSGNVFSGFLDECWKAEANCSLARLGSLEDVKAQLHSFIENLRDEPLNVYVNSTSYGVLTRNDVWLRGIFIALYKPTAWNELADRLSGLLQGNGTDAFSAFHDDGSIVQNKSEAYHFVTLNDGASGPGHWPSNLTGFLDDLSRSYGEQEFSDSELDTYFVKHHWSIPKTHPYVPRRGVQTVHPLLILSTTYDPICPLVSARSAVDAFVGSRLVEAKGYGHCSIAMPSMCIARHVRAFLADGTLPEEGAQCEIDGPYFTKPEDSTELAAAWVEFEDPEEERIHRAQVALARDSWF